MRVKYALIIITVLLVSSSCTRLKDGNPSVTPSPGVDKADLLYPHSEQFSKTKKHGQEYAANNRSCKACHGQDLSGGNSKTGCSKCHDDYPHTAEFKTTYTHGVRFFATKKKGCKQCHKETSKEKNDKNASSCEDCHSFPHNDPDWIQTNHGKVWLGSTKPENGPDNKKCLTCHSEESGFKSRHPDEWLSCSTCHILVPHSDDFKQGDHLGASEKDDVSNNCLGCHLEFTKNMPNYSSGCFDCHMPEDFSPKNFSNTRKIDSIRPRKVKR